MMELSPREDPKMSIHKKRASHKTGMSPGTLMHIGDRKTEETRIRLIDYSEDHIEEKTLSDITDTFSCKETSSVSWINIDGLHEVSLFEKLGKQFNFHPLILEDVLNTGQRPKMDDLETYIFLVMKMISYNEVEEDLVIEQLSIILTPNGLFTFQERPGDYFDALRERIRQGKGRIRKMKADYLAYSLVDIVVDNYFTAMEKIGDKIEFLEDDLIDNPNPEILQKLHQLKRDLIMLRRAVWPMREMISSLQRLESPLFSRPTEVFLRDLYDHTVQVLDTIESYRDLVTGMLDIYLSSLSNRMNEVMKVLTIIATIFIPLTFVAGVYGMNFHAMPELDWPWAYPMGFWIINGVLAIWMIVFFRKRNWL